MGIVPVQVKGSVCINDALYASPNFPGFAISSYHLTGKELRGGALIGYAFSSHRTDDELAVSEIVLNQNLLKLNFLFNFICDVRQYVLFL